MTVKIYKAEDARAQMRAVLDDALMGRAESVIERNGKPAAVVISYERWQRLEQERKKKLEQFAAARADLDAGNYRTWEAVKAEMIEAGLL